MMIEFDPIKRLWTLEHRGLDFNEAELILYGDNLTRVDARRDYGEVRQITLGMLHERIVVLVWTERGDSVRVISLRVADHDEREIYRVFVG